MGNKIDKIPPSEWSERLKGKGFLPVSATEGFGLDKVRSLLEKRLLEVTGRRAVVVRCKTGGEEAVWLQRNVTVSEVVPDVRDENYSMVTVVVTDVDMAKFKKDFGIMRREESY